MRFLVVGAAMILGAASVEAATVTASSTLSAAELAAATTPTPGPDASTGVVSLDVTGSIPRFQRSPFDTIPGLETTGVYNAVQEGSTATYTFGTLQTAFSLIWGSPDTFNVLAFFKDGMQVDLGAFGSTLTGDEVVMVAGLPQLARGVASVSITGIQFDEVRLGSKLHAFEYAQIDATPIPLPGAAWLSLAGLGMLFLARRRAVV